MMQDTDSEIEQLLHDKATEAANKKKYNPNKIARNIISHYNVFFYGDSFFIYSNGRHVLQNDIQMRSIVHDEIGDEYRQAKFKEITDCMMAQCLTQEINLCRGVNCLNGVYEFDTTSLVSHNQTFRYTNQVQTNFDPQAKCPKWLGFLNQILDDDPCKISVLQEYSGYCLDPNLNLEMILFLLGRGANGKSVFCNAIQSVIGEDGCENLSLDDLRKPNYLAELLGKYVNIATESQSKAEVYESTLKRLASGEPIKVDRKFKNPFTFRSNCKHIYCLNNLPRVGDKTDAFFRRVMPIPFNVQISKRDQIIKYGEQLADEERSGILNWMIEGYLRLKRQGWQFTECKQITELLTDYRRDNNNVLSFVDECCELIPEASIPIKDVYEKYVSWCKASGVQPLKKKSVTHEIVENFKVERSRDTDSRNLSGITLSFEING